MRNLDQIEFFVKKYNTGLTVDVSLELVQELRRLRAAIETHRSQKADDRCIEDDDRLYEALGDGIRCDRRVGDKAAMLENCRRFIENRCQDGGWKTYAELEAENEELRRQLRQQGTREVRDEFHGE